MPRPITYSVIIPVFNSEALVAETIRRTVAFFETRRWTYEIILVNDGSTDQSWPILESAALSNPHVVVVDMLRNYGQHTAVYAGFHHAKGDYVITLDDDLQNPPEEIVHLVEKIQEGYDVVYGQFRTKQHAGYRRLGSRLIQAVNQRIFRQPPDLVATNFRILDRELVQRICDYRTPFPYITGLSLMFSAKRANVLVDHHSRSVGKSNYSLVRILTLVMRILFSYSTFPLHCVSLFGFAVALLSFIAGIFVFIRALLVRSEVAGWASLVIILSFLIGMNIAISSMVGEYVIRLVKQHSQRSSYHLRRIINYHE